MNQTELDFEESYKNCITRLGIIKANFGHWINTELFLAKLEDIEEDILTLSNEIIDAGFQDQS